MLTSTNNLTKNRIVQILEKHKRDIQRYKVRKLGLFGSYLKKKQHKASDIDILVSFDEVTFDNYMELKFLLEKMFCKKIDLVTEESLKPALEYIKEDALYAKI